MPRSAPGSTIPISTATGFPASSRLATTGPVSRCRPRSWPGCSIPMTCRPTPISASGSPPRAARPRRRCAIAPPPATLPICTFTTVPAVASPSGRYEMLGLSQSITSLAHARDEANAIAQRLRLALQAAKAGVFEFDYARNDIWMSPELAGDDRSRGGGVRRAGPADRLPSRGPGLGHGGDARRWARRTEDPGRCAHARPPGRTLDSFLLRGRTEQRRQAQPGRRADAGCRRRETPGPGPDRGAQGGRGRDRRQVHLPGLGQPRNPHADERYCRRAQPARPRGPDAGGASSCARRWVAAKCRRRN